MLLRIRIRGYKSYFSYCVAKYPEILKGRVIPGKIDICRLPEYVNTRDWWNSVSRDDEMANYQSIQAREVPEDIQEIFYQQTLDGIHTQDMVIWILGSVCFLGVKFIHKLFESHID